MDPEAFTASLFKWDPRALPTSFSATAAAAMGAPPPPPAGPPPPVGSTAYPFGGAPAMRLQLPPPNNNNNSNSRDPQQQLMVVAGAAAGQLGGLEELFQAYGIRYYTIAKIGELGFTASTLVDMKDEELDDMMTSLSYIFRWDLLVGERYGIKAAVRAERRRLEEQQQLLEESRRRHLLLSGSAHPHDPTTTHPLDALSQEGLSEEAVQQEKEAAAVVGGSNWPSNKKHNSRRHQQTKRTSSTSANTNKKMGKMLVSSCYDNMNEQELEIEDHHHHHHHHHHDLEEDDDEENGVGERQREHPFIVTEPGEVARGKKNGLDYLFHLYEQCREFLLQVQAIAKHHGEKCPTKVTNQVFRYAKKAGATYINKPKMRHYVHCYALHCLDEPTSNALRHAFKERGENVGAWRQACYRPLVAIASRQGWDIDAIFNSHPRLTIWYVPTKLRQLCHAERSSSTTTAASSSISGGPSDHHLPF